MISREKIIEKLVHDLGVLQYFIYNSKIIRVAHNIIPLLYELCNYLNTIITYAYIWKLDDLNGLCHQWVKNSEIVTHDIQAIIYNKYFIQKLIDIPYTFDFNPYDMNREWFLPFYLIN